MHHDDDLRALTRHQIGLASLDQLRLAGVTSRVARRRVTTGEWARVTRGVYDTRPGAVGSLPWDARRRRAAWAGLLAFGPDAIAVGTSALALLGVEGLPARARPEVALPGASDRCSRDGVRLRQFDDGMTVTRVGGRFVATADWALAQAVPELPRQHGLAVLDSALRLGMLDRAGLVRAHDHARGRRGVAVTHPLWDLADGRAESPLESFGRLDCIDAGVPPDVLQLPVRDADERVVARGDMGWRLRGGRWLVAEMDGADVHAAPEAVYADRARQNLMVASGTLDVLRFTGRDLPGGVGRAVAAVLRREHVLGDRRARDQRPIRRRPGP